MIWGWRAEKRSLIGLVAAGQALDLVTTVVNIRILGFVELNPLLSGLSLGQFAAGKVILTMGSVLVMNRLPLPRWFYWVMVVGSVIPGAWNLGMVMLELIAGG